MIWRLDLPSNGTLIMGRAQDCDLVLPALMVSQHHLRLDITNGTDGILENAGNTRLGDNLGLTGLDQLVVDE